MDTQDSTLPTEPQTPSKLGGGALRGRQAHPGTVSPALQEALRGRDRTAVRRREGNGGELAGERRYRAAHT